VTKITSVAIIDLVTLKGGTKCELSFYKLAFSHEQSWSKARAIVQQKPHGSYLKASYGYRTNNFKSGVLNKK
jgi:hypothetical protein